MGLFGTNGVRGILGVDLSLADVHKITMSIAAHARPGPVLVGHDGRDTSSPMAMMVYSSMCLAGRMCANAGLVPTPCLALGVRELGYSCGIMITASHNPPEYGGLKVIWHDGIESARSDEIAIETIHAAKSWELAMPWGSVTSESRTIPTYHNQILKHVDESKIAESDLAVVLDIGNGAQAYTAESLATRLSKSVKCIHGNVDPKFGGRGPEPTPDNLSALSDAVSESGADIGIAFDGDGDRSIICDEHGVILNGDTSALFLVNHLLSSSPNSDIVTPINSGDSIDDIAAAADSNVIRTSVGSVIVSRTMAGINALAGFEENGGFMYGPHLPVRDGLMTMALAMAALSEQHSTLSSLVDRLPKSFTSKMRLESTPESARAAIRRLVLEHPDADMRDGIKIRLGSHRWVMARPSGTEPIIRLYAESDSKSSLDSLLAEYSTLIRKYLK